MFIELEPIFNNVGSSKKFSYSFVPDGIDFTDSVSVEGEVVNNTDIVSVKAVAKYVLKTNCDRCGAPVERKTEVPIEHILISRLNDEDNDEFILVEDMKLDLDSLVREDMILALPAKILCRDDCKGLCQYCGKNLNLGSWSCKKPSDRMLPALAELLIDECIIYCNIRRAKNGSTEEKSFISKKR